MRYIVANVKGTLIGHGYPVLLQSMTNCSTNDIDAAVEQCTALAGAGAGLIRLTTQGEREVESLGKIKAILRSRGIDTPLVADIHFRSDVAILAASVADKVRINPGNFARDPQKARTEFARLLKFCKERGTAVRIGINHGSLGSRITETYGNTPQGMMEAMWEWVEMAEKENFDNLVLSLKASSVPVMTAAYALLQERMEAHGTVYPLHLGVTEAGNADMGRIKSAAGIAALLTKGIGDTIRVSLTESPVNEIPAAAKIVKHCDRLLSGVSYAHIDAEDHEDFIIGAACAYGPGLLAREIDDFSLSATVGGRAVSPEDLEHFKNDLLQATRRRITQCEYVACPGCGRTLYDIEKVFNEVKKRTSHLKGVTIAVMGCIVNGPGEMADADYGYIGAGRGTVSIYRKQTPVMQRIPQEEAIERLVELIEQDRRLSDETV